MNEQESYSYKVGTEPCPKCREMGNDNSGDNLAVYSDEHKFCFACKYYVGGNKETMNTPPPVKEFTPINGNYEPIPSRGLDEKTCRKYGYTVARKDGKVYHVASVYRNRELVGQHVRQEDPKDFKWVGSPRGAELFGQHLFEKGGKRIVVTEGEVDAMTVFQVNNGWPVVSLPNGVQSAVRSIKDNIEFLAAYDEVILMFDNDDAGQEAATEVAQILPPGKTRIASLPLKDANECLMNGQSKAVVSAIWQAHEYSPDEIMHVRDVEPEVIDPESILPYPWDCVNNMIIGNKAGDLTLWASGTGSGKSTILRELASYHLDRGKKVGMVMLEESPSETKDDMISLKINSPVRAVRATKLINAIREREGKAPIEKNFANFTEEAYTEAKDNLDRQGLFLYKHMGRKAMDNIMGRIEHMAVSSGCDLIILDHITALASAMIKDESSNERIIIDQVMSSLESLAERTGCRFHIVTQLKKTDKKFEEGAVISMQDLKGSGSLGHTPDTVISLERNRQDPDPTQANTTVCRILKSRMQGSDSGVAGAFLYSKETGRLSEVEYVVNDEGKIESNPNPFGGI